MGRRAKPDVGFPALIREALPDLREAERTAPRTGRGDKPDIPDWLFAGLIMVALLRKKKSKSSQYRFLSGRRADLADGFGTGRFPARATYFRRYRRGSPARRGAGDLLPALPAGLPALPGGGPAAGRAGHRRGGGRPDRLGRGQDRGGRAVA